MNIIGFRCWRLHVIILSLIIPLTAQAENVGSENSVSSSWFVEGRYQKSISESTGISDNDTTAARIASGTGEKWDNLDSVGIAIGRTFKQGNLGLSLGYESFGTVNKSYTTLTQQNGTVINNVVTPMDIRNFMVEVSYKIPLSDGVFAMGLAGVGNAIIDSKRYTVGGVIDPAGSAREVTNTSTRFGVGIGYQINEKTSIIAVAQKSDYGDAEVLSPTTISTDVNATEASIRLRYSF